MEETALKEVVYHRGGGKENEENPPQADFSLGASRIKNATDCLQIFKHFLYHLILARGERERERELRGGCVCRAIQI